jgi:hypothetical protein
LNHEEHEGHEEVDRRHQLPRTFFQKIEKRRGKSIQPDPLFVSFVLFVVKQIRKWA